MREKALMVGSAGYIADVVVALLSPGFESSLSLFLAMPSGIAEISFLLWLWAKGAQIPQRDRPIPAAV